jgi:hypothetical protein
MANSYSRPLRVFLCHSSGDKPAVRELYRRLNAEGWIDVWLDEEKLLPGQDWDYEIEKALDKSDAVIVTLSAGSVSKEGYIQKELRFVLDLALEKPEGTIFILPVRLEDCERPRRLRSIQGIDYFPPERHEAAYARLRQSLALRAQHLNLLANMPVNPPSPSQASPMLPNSDLSTPVKVDPSVRPEPTLAPDEDQLIKTHLITKLGRGVVIFSLILALTQPWIRKTIPGPAFIDYGWNAAIVDFFGSMNISIIMPTMVVTLFLLTLARLIPTEFRDHNALLSLERLSAGIAPLTMFIPIVAVDTIWRDTYLLRGFWLTMWAAYLASLNILFELRLNRKIKQWPQWAWVLVISIILSWLLLIWLQWL